jgi:4'-phosphopantetheinyl transferase
MNTESLESLRLEFLPAPDLLDRPADELHVWSIDLSRKSPQQRRAAANAALRQVLAAYLGTTPQQIELASGEHGKPQLAGGVLEFNLSHSGEIALVALSAEHPVGVDVEQVQPNRDLLAVAERALSAEDVEAVRVAAPAERALVFHQHWARHEARLKCLGVGIFRESSFDTAAVKAWDLDLGPGYAGAVAIEADELPPLRCWIFEPESASKRPQPG